MGHGEFPLSKRNGEQTAQLGQSDGRLGCDRLALGCLCALARLEVWLWRRGQAI